MTTTTTHPAPTRRASHPATSSRLTRPILLAGLVGGAATASGIALTATSGWLIVRASERPVILTLLTAIVAVRAFGMARPTFRYAERLRSHDAALADLAERRQSVFASLIPLTPARLGRRARSDVLTGVVDDLSDVVDAQVRVTVPVIASAVAGLLAVALTAALWPPVGAVLAALLVLVALACLLAWRLESRGRDEMLAARAEVARVSDLVAGQADALRAVGAEQTALRWLTDAHDTLRRCVRRQSHGRALVTALLLLASGAATLLAAWLALGADVSAPIKALLVVVPVATGDALAPLVDAMRSRALADGAVARLDDLLAQHPAVAAATLATPQSRPASTGGSDAAHPSYPAAAGTGVSAAAAPTSDPGQHTAFPAPAQPDPTAPAPAFRTTAPALQLRGVTASWTGQGTDLAALDLDIASGERLAIVGANGSGKSTLLAVLARQLDPTAGAYTIDGQDALSADLADTRALFAVLDDEPHIFAGPADANLRVAAPDADDDALRAALVAAGLTSWLGTLPQGLATPLGAGGRGLSGGERARFGLARALLSERPVLLLDEPLAHVDHATALGIIEDLSRVERTRSIVMVSHRPEGIDGFDTVLDLSPRFARKEF
ncbi:MAG: ATP-binding cassette domain-containing protein [Phycicoccus sp.]|nr:ATP-binding cassette domain-containing protein [Phycicoccus sp.]